MFGLSLSRLGSAMKRLVWNPRIALFGNGEIGVIYDPSDLTTMYQDSAGTTAVTAVEQPVGLILDKSKGLVLGAELVAGDTASFISGVGDWISIRSGTITASGGKGLLTPVTETYSGAKFTSAMVVGRYYILSFTYRLLSGTAQVLEARGMLRAAGSGESQFTPTATEQTFTQKGFSLTNIFQVTNGNVTPNGAVYEIDNISVRELPGNHASQSTAVSRPTLSQRVNLLTKTEDFGNAVWTKSAATVTADQANGLDGTLTADQITATATNGQVFRNTTVPAAVASYTQSIYVKKANTGAVFRYDIRDTVNNYAYTFNLDTLAVVKLSATATAATITPVGGGLFLVSITASNATGGATLSTYAIIPTSGDSFYIWGASLVPADQASLPYQRVDTSTVYDTSAVFPRYLKFDGVDDFLSTASIDFTAGDKMTVVAGVRKLSDAALGGYGCIVELSASTAANNGSFSHFSPSDAPGSTPSIGGIFKGTIIANASVPTGYASPISFVSSIKGDIAGDSASLRLNGVQVAATATDQGTGNFGNYPLYIGRRGGTIYPFNGHLYSLIVRGAQSTDAQIASAETYVAGKTGVVLPSPATGSFLLLEDGSYILLEDGSKLLLEA